MRKLGIVFSTRAALAMLSILASALGTRATAEPLREGDAIDLGGRTATFKSLDTLPYVESDYTRRFKFDSYENPKLQELRTRYKLDEVVAPGRDEFDKQVLLMDWTHQQFKEFGQPSTTAKGALEILKAIDEGHTFFCSQYAQLLVSAAASLGWADRPLALRRHQGVAKVGGSTEHSVTEIWSNQYRKWVMLDPTSNLYLEKKGMPLNAYEIRQEWFYQEGTNLVFVVGKERKTYRKSDLPIFLQHFAGFGDLAIHPDELDKYGFTAYIPNTDLMDSGFDYGGMFIVKDQLCDGTKWHVRTVPENPAVDPYFPIGQAALSLFAEQGKISVALKTLTPNFKRFEVQFDDGGWSASDDTFIWNMHDGQNRLAARTLNRFGVTGPISTAVLEIGK
jgi:transglutaminase-like putative cysteine protease